MQTTPIAKSLYRDLKEAIQHKRAIKVKVSMESFRKRNMDIDYIPHYTQRPAIILAVTVNSPEIVKIILDYGSNLNKLANGNTPLHYAAAYGYLEIVTLFIEYGARLDARDEKRSQTPLIWAVQNGEIEVVDYLLEINQQTTSLTDVNGYTALMYAVLNDDLDSSKLLVKANTSTLAIKNRQEKTAQDLANNKEISKLLATASAFG